MYNFIDVNEVQEGTSLPSEALKINGEYIENLIEGYRTLHVSGREALSPEIELYNTGVRDGSTMKYKRFPERSIIVTYQLIAKSNEAFRNAYNALGRILNVKDAQLIFNDESDKFFIGTPSAIGEVEAGTNSVVGEFELLCADPFKYSLMEYTAEPLEDGSFAINYNGTYKSYPKLVAEFYKENEVSADGNSTIAPTGNGDCGYVSFFNDKAKIIQLGDPDEADTEEVPASQTLMNQTFLTNVSWGTGAKKLWTVNTGIDIPANPLHIGTVAMLESGEKANGMVGTHYMACNGHGTAANKWHGASITRNIGADAAGDVGAKDFLLTFKHKMSIGSGSGDTAQYGRFCVFLLDAEDNIVIGADIHKYRAGKKGAIAFYVGNTHVKGVEIDLSYGNKYLGHGNTTSYMRKTGNEFVFNMCGHRYSFTNNEWKEKVATKVLVFFGTYSNFRPLTHNGLFWVKLDKHNCDTYADVPNKFSANDVLEADCRTGEILLNGTPSPELGAMGNDWEEFVLENGLNQIDTSYSKWIQTGYEPDFKVKYREVFL